MFIEARGAGMALKKPEKILIRARGDEKERLAERARELFLQTEIVSETGDQFLCSSLPVTDELFKLIDHFKTQNQNLTGDQKEQSYYFKAAGDRFCVVSSAPAGLFYGMLSLAEFFAGGGGEVEMFDFPRFGCRGFLQDLSRGQVLNLFGFGRLVKQLGSYRYNWLTFNLEHNFGYGKYPDIWEGDDSISPDEATVLAHLCREYHIDVVPMQQSLGHCRGILNKDKYRRLAFDGQLLWSLDPRNDEIYSLLSDFYHEQAECFPGKYFLVGCDEPFDLKKKWKPENAGGNTLPQAYLDHLCKLNGILSAMGRKMMVWGDVFVAHPELLKGLPDDAVVLNWQYGTSQLEQEPFYESRTQAIAESKKDFYVATSTWSYARLFPELKTMEANNRNFLNVGARMGAKGALLTNWGDLGHMQLLGYLALPIAYFGRHSWKESKATLPEFAVDFSGDYFGDRTGKTGEFYLLLERVNEIITPGSAFGASALFVLLDELFSIQFLPAQPLPAATEELLDVLKKAATVTSSLTGIKNYEGILDLKPVIYALGVLFTKFLLKENASFAVSDPSKKEEILSLFNHLINYCGTLRESLKDRWLTQAKPVGLDRNLKRLVKVTEGYKMRMEQIKGAKDVKWEQLRDAPEFVQYRFNLMKEMGLEGLL